PSFPTRRSSDLLQDAFQETDALVKQLLSPADPRKPVIRPPDGAKTGGCTVDLQILPAPFGRNRFVPIPVHDQDRPGIGVYPLVQVPSLQLLIKSAAQRHSIQVDAPIGTRLSRPKA